MNIQQVFPSFIATERLNLDNEMIRRYVHLEHSISRGRVISNVKGWQSNPLTDQNTPEVLQPLVDEVLLRANFLHRYYQLSELYNQRINNYWINLNEPGSYNLAHTHAGTMFSAVYYVEAPENSGDLEFMHPVPGHEYTIREEHVGQLNDFNGGLIKITPKAGDLVLFPSWLMHFVRMNESYGDRISIAFDTKAVPA